jgi:hypothetical protein
VGNGTASLGGNTRVQQGEEKQKQNNKIET